MPTFETPRPISATVDMATGHLHITASDRPDTAVDVRPTDPADDGDVAAADQTVVELSGDRLVVRTPRNRLRSLFGRPPSVEITVDLPTASRVEVSAAGEVRGDGRLGETRVETAAGAVRLAETGRLQVRTSAGDVSVARSDGPTEITTASGKVRVGAVEGSAVVKSSNGDITVGEVSGAVRLTTANGDIAVDRALATVAAKTAFGSVRVGEVARGAVVLETGFGEVEVGVRPGTAAWLDVKSGMGSVRSLLDAAAEPAATDDTVEVRARTGYGDIVIRRAEPATGPA